MSKKGPPTIEPLREVEDSPKLIRSGGVGTETIDLDSLFTRDVTASGSFDVSSVQTTSFATLLHALPIPALLLDGSRNIVFANRACGRIGAGYEKIRGSLFSALFPDPAASQKAMDLLDSVFSTRNPRVAEFVITIDGNSIWGRLSFRSLRIGGDRLVLVLVEDLSLEKQQLAVTKKQQDELEQRVRERTAELNRLNDKLMLEVIQRKEAEERIRESLSEKDVMLQEIHHRVKNNLQIISSLLGLHIRQVEDLRALAALKDSQSRVRSMALIHEQLYRSGDLAAIDFTKYTEELTRALLPSYSEAAGIVSLKMKADDVFFRIETAIPLGLIVNELISNCLKHAFPKGRPGEIRVELLKGPGDEYSVVVADNGKGLPKDLDFHTAKSLGLRIVKELTESQLKGRLEIKSEKGTEFRIIFQDRNQPKRGPDKWRRQQ